MLRKTLSGPWAYAAAVAGVALATVLRNALHPVLGPNYPFATYFFVVIVTAWACGLGPSIVALVLGAVYAWFFFLPPFASVRVPDAITLTGIFLYLSLGGVSIAIIETQRRAHRRLEAEMAEKEQAKAGYGRARTITFTQWR